MFSNLIISTLLLVYTYRSSYDESIFQYTHYQTENSLTCIRDSTPHPEWKDHHVFLFRPIEKRNKYPVIFFCHGITADNPMVYEAFIRHMVSRGYAVIYSPYPTGCSYFFPCWSYEILWNGFVKGASAWRSCLDMRNIGFVGHSYGAGAIPSLARRAIVFKGWGRESAFLYMMAPWFVHGISQRQLQHFPRHVKVIVEVFADDCINDHRIGKDIYLSIGVPDTLKVFCVLSATVSQKGLPADHDIPVGISESSLSVNDFDFCGVYFIFDVISSYLSNPFAGKARFRHEDHTYLVKGPSGDCCRIDTYRKPVMERAQNVCVNFWCHALNPRRKFYKHIGEPLRILLTTPETIINYGTLAMTAIGSR